MPLLSFSTHRALLPIVLLLTSDGAAQTDALRFQRLQLSGEFLTEGAAFGDLNGDGQTDVIAGPYYYLGPDFRQRHEIYPPQVFDPLKYSDNFFAEVRDVNGDGRNDVLGIGFPGAEAFWFENPGASGGHWPRQVILDGVGNESAVFADLTGDGRPELLGSHERQLGYAVLDPRHPTARWSFQPITPVGNWLPFTHGLGFGDVDGDGRVDLVESNGWWRQPASLPSEGPWQHHPMRFASGGAQMLVYDVNGDGWSDVITSINAHGYGLSWYQQVRDGQGGISFREHRILAAEGGERLQEVQFSQLHALALADLDGDGLMDVVTGKRWWAHGPQKDPEPNAHPVVYGFLLRRGASAEVSYRPVRIDDNSGVGTWIHARDINGDGRADLVTANKRGTFLFLSQAPAE